MKKVVQVDSGVEVLLDNFYGRTKGQGLKECRIKTLYSDRTKLRTEAPGGEADWGGVV